MSEPSTAAPLVWRFPPYQPALGFLTVSACAAVNLYGHPEPSLRVFTLVVGAVALGLAIVLLRMAFVVDSDGLAVRFLLRANWVPWTDVKAVGLTCGAAKRCESSASTTRGSTCPPHFYSRSGRWRRTARRPDSVGSCCVSWPSVLARVPRCNNLATLALYGYR